VIYGQGALLAGFESGFSNSHTIGGLKEVDRFGRFLYCGNILPGDQSFIAIMPTNNTSFGEGDLTDMFIVIL
jgi:hypothetical protein